MKVEERSLHIKGKATVGSCGSVTGEKLLRGTFITIEAPGPIPGKARVTAYSDSFPGLRFLSPRLARFFSSSERSYDMPPEKLLGR